MARRGAVRSESRGPIVAHRCAVREVSWLGIGYLRPRGAIEALRLEGQRLRIYMTHSKPVPFLHKVVTKSVRASMVKIL